MQIVRNGDPFASNIPRYFVYTILKGFHFGLITAMWVIYLQQAHGLSLTQVTMVDVGFWVASTLGELPTGIVADSYGRKTSLAVGTAIMGASILVWSFAPTLPLLVAAYIFLAIGATFLSGAEEAFFFESIKLTGRSAEYTRLVGRLSATMLASIAVGNLSSGLLATLDLRLPFVVAGVALLTMMAIVFTFREPRLAENAEGQPRTSYVEIIRQALAILRARPALRYTIGFLTLIPVTAVIMETVFLQPQALALGVPLAGVGVVVMAVQFSNMAGSITSHRAKITLGESKILYSAPFLIAASLLLLSFFQMLPALLFAAAISFLTALLRPILMSRIQHEVSDHVRATVLSMQSLLFAMLLVFTEPLLGYVADLSGLPTAYRVLAIALVLLLLFLFWRGRHRFP